MELLRGFTDYALAHRAAHTHRNELWSALYVIC